MTSFGHLSPAPDPTAPRSVPYLDLRRANTELSDELRDACARVIDSGRYILAGEVDAFETAFARFCGSRHCVGVGNGLHALSLTLCALGVGPGDEVIVPANTYIATWLAVSRVGATPVPVEPDVPTYNIDPTRIEAAITPRTKLLLPVHLYGQPADLAPIGKVAHDQGLLLVDDAAQAHGARYDGQRIGALGDATAFSFYPTKNLGGIGDGGAIVTRSAELAEQLRLRRNYGSRRKYHNELQGDNSRLDELQAALLSVKLSRLDAWNDRRRELAARYLEGLSEVPGLALPAVAAGAEPVWHVFAVRHERRDELQRHLEAAGIGTLLHYPIPPHLSEAYRGSGWARGDFPATERLADELLSLPLAPHLADAEADAVIEAVRAFA